MLNLMLNLFKASFELLRMIPCRQVGRGIEAVVRGIRDSKLHVRVELLTKS